LKGREICFSLDDKNGIHFVGTSLTEAIYKAGSESGIFGIMSVSFYSVMHIKGKLE